MLPILCFTKQLVSLQLYFLKKVLITQHLIFNQYKLIFLKNSASFLKSLFIPCAILGTEDSLIREGDDVLCEGPLDQSECSLSVQLSTDNWPACGNNRLG